MRCPIPKDLNNHLDCIKDPLIFVAGVGMTNANPKKQHSGKGVKIVGRHFDGSWKVCLTDNPNTMFTVHREQLRVVKDTHNLGYYL